MMETSGKRRDRGHSEAAGRCCHGVIKTDQRKKQSDGDKWHSTPRCRGDTEATRCLAAPRDRCALNISWQIDNSSDTGLREMNRQRVSWRIIKELECGAFLITNAFSLIKSFWAIRDSFQWFPLTMTTISSWIIKAFFLTLKQLKMVDCKIFDGKKLCGCPF